MKSKIHNYYDSGVTPMIASDLHKTLMADDETWYEFINEKPKKSKKKQPDLPDLETEEAHTVYTNRRPIYFDAGEGHNAGRKAKDGRILNVYEYDDDFTEEDHKSYQYSATLTNLWQAHIKCGYADDRKQMISESGYTGTLEDIYKKRQSPRSKIFDKKLKVRSKNEVEKLSKLSPHLKKQS